MPNSSAPGTQDGSAGGGGGTNTRPQSPSGGIPKPVALQSNDQWMMRVNRHGLPICRDLHGLFTTVIISLSDRWPDWRFPLAFVLPAVIQRMQALQFVQIVRDAANGMQNMLSLSQTKTSFTMNSETAARICDAFIKAHLLERMPEQENEVYTPSPKGVHLIDRFVIRHGIATRSVSNLLNVHRICDKLLFMERDDQDDILLSDAVVRIVFNRMVGTSPKRTESSALGMVLETTHARDQQGQLYETARFASADALHWLVQYTTLVSVDEAIVIAAHMVRLGWLESEDSMEPSMSNNVATVRVDEALRVEHASCEGTFVEGETYHLTELGVTTAWKVAWIEQPASMPADERPPTSFFFGDRSNEMRSVSPRLDAFELYGTYANAHPSAQASPEIEQAAQPEARNVSSPLPGSVPRRPLEEVLKSTAMRRSFHAFLKTSQSEKPLQFWCEVEWFRSDCRLATTGVLTDVSRADDVDVLPFEVLREAQEKRPPAMTGPQMRVQQQPILAQSARTRIGTFLETSALDLRLSSATREALARALHTYTARSADAADTTRHVEKELASLLIQCAAAQKEVKVQLRDECLPRFYEALDCGLWARP